MLKKLEIAVMRAFNAYRVPFLAITFTGCMMSAANTRRSLVIRFMPPLMAMPFISMYN